MQASGRLSRSQDARPRSAATPSQTPAGRARSTGNGLRIGVVFSNRLFDQAHGLSCITPTVESRSRRPTPPGLVQKTHHPTKAAFGEADQSVAPPFFFGTVGRGWLSSVWPAPGAPPSAPR